MIERELPCLSVLLNYRYVPGNDERKLSKVPSLLADCICLDCEDGVAIDKKISARNNIRQIFEGNCLFHKFFQGNVQDKM